MINLFVNTDTDVLWASKGSRNIFCLLAQKFHVIYFTFQVVPKCQITDFAGERSVLLNLQNHKCNHAVTLCASLPKSPNASQSKNIFLCVRVEGGHWNNFWYCNCLE